MINYTLDRNIAIISWAMTSVPLNVLNDESIPPFEAALQRAFADESVKGLIITSAKPEFVAGADLKMILRNNDKDPSDMMRVSSELNRIFRTIETSGKPAVAAINGTALGGGYEICLACHHRVALNNPKTLLGLVEVTIGLLPGAGGTQRLPRMLGIEAALPLILEGKKAGVQEAKTLGMIDAIADTPADMMEQARAWIAANPKPIKPWDEVDRKTGAIVGRDHFKGPGGPVQSAAGARAFGIGTALLMAKTKGNYPAPLAVMACVYEGLQVNIDRALVIEARYFATIATSKVARNLIQTLFLGVNEANKGASRPQDQPKTNAKKIGIVGGGLMGAGIVYAAARAGIEVVLKDVSIEAAEEGKAYARQLFQKDIERGQADPQRMDDTLDLIKTTTGVQDQVGCDLIIEATPKNRALKVRAIREGECVPAVNGAANFGSGNAALPALPISQRVPASTNIQNIIGMHLFAPINQGTLVELIVGKPSSDYALAVAIDFIRKLRKTPIVVSDSRGFYTSRCFDTYLAEGMELLKEGVNPILIQNGGIDAGMPTGPLTGTDEGAQNRAYTLTDTQPTLEAVKMRLLYRQAIEAVRCFEERVVRTKLDADLGSILGWGFPSYTGGALSFVDFVGVRTFVDILDQLADAHGERFRPTEALRKRYEEAQ